MKIGWSSGKVSRPISTGVGWKIIDPGRDDTVPVRVFGGVGGAGDSRGVVEVKACVEADCTSDALDGSDEATLLADARGLPPNADMKERTVRNHQQGHWNFPY